MYGANVVRRSRYLPGEYGGGGFQNNLCLNFDGIDDCVTMGDVLDKTVTDHFSVFCWVNTVSVVASYLVSKQTTVGGQEGYSISINANRIWVTLRGAGGQILLRGFNTFPKSDGNNHSIGITYDGSSTAAGTIIYLDGVVENRTVLVNALAGAMGNTSPFLISSIFRAAPAVSPLAGLMKDVSIWSTDLTPGEVTELHNGGAPGNLLAHSQAGNLEGWWRLGDGVGDGFATIMDQVGGNHGTMTAMAADDFVAWP